MTSYKESNNGISGSIIKDKKCALFLTIEEYAIDKAQIEEIEKSMITRFPDLFMEIGFSVDVPSKHFALAASSNIRLYTDLFRAVADVYVLNISNRYKEIN